MIKEKIKERKKNGIEITSRILLRKRDRV